MKRGTGSTKKPTTQRGRGTYASHACNVCRVKRVKCDEAKPVCTSCQSSGREDECSYTAETARRPRTEAHYEAMRKHADALKCYVDLLESLLEKCRLEHGGVSDEHTSYLQFKPPDATGLLESDAIPHNEEKEPSITDEDDITLELCVPARNLKLHDSDLFFYGIAAPFRFQEVPVSPKTTSLSRFPKMMNTPRHVLQLTDSDGNHYDPNFDWSRHLPDTVPLDRKEHDRIINLLFKFFTSWCLRIVPALFLRDMHVALSVPRHQTPPKTSHYSPMLHNALMALATAFSDDPKIRDYKSRKYFSDEAKRLWESECAKPNLAMVHALSLLGSFHSTNGEQTIGYVYFGMSTRLSQALGLSFDSSTWVQASLITHDDMVDRNWAYWTLFSQDVCWSLYVGRDFGVSLPSERNVPVPLIDKDYDESPWIYPPSNKVSQPNCLSRTFAATCGLLQIARHIMEIISSSLNTHSTGTRIEVSDAVISRIDLQLHEWKSQLPPEVELTIHNRSSATPHKLMVHLTFWSVFILLHRPFFHRRKRDSEAVAHVKLCKRACDNIMELVATWRSLYTLRYCPVTMMQTIFSAGTVFLLLANKASSGLRVAKKDLETFSAQAKLCIQYLNEIGKSWNSSTNIAEILTKLSRKQLEPLTEKRTARRCSKGNQRRMESEEGAETIDSSESVEETPPGPVYIPPAAVMSMPHHKRGPPTRLRLPSWRIWVHLGTLGCLMETRSQMNLSCRM
ncbi:hypothetical protein BDZ89DRAFT_832235 [Hymenopellis radicata]|nr:hypothetical protein BDZ89DRAFT_832235 [Hymenopellis radicata]